MSEEAASETVRPPAGGARLGRPHRPAPPPFGTRARVRAGLRRPDAWLQLLRFGCVGASGYVVNLAVFALTVGGFGHRGAATAAFAVAVTNNFAWNRLWTFRARASHAGHQALRFLTVSVLAFLAGLGVLELLVVVLGVSEVPAQAASIVAVTPLSFLGNKLWTFDR